MNVLIDPSVWSLALRRARIIGIIRQELLSGIKAQPQFEKLRDIVRAFPDELVNTADYEAAALASNQCRSKGVAVSVSDMLLCAVAQSRDWAIFSTDPDFSRYAKMLPIKLHDVRQ